MDFNHRVAFGLVALMVLSSSGCRTFDVRSGGATVRTRDAYVKVVFSDRDKEAIRGFYSTKGKYKKMPPGLAKRSTLPPGLQKRIDAGQPLPPGLQRESLPYELEEILSPLPKGYIRLRVGGDIVIWNQKTEVVVDILKDICL